MKKLFSTCKTRFSVFISLMSIWAFALCPAEADAARPDADTAQTLFERMATLHYHMNLPDFESLDDQLLDQVAKEHLANGVSPMAAAVRRPHEAPELFENAGNSPQGIPWDCAIARKDAAAITAWYFGRPAPLEDTGEYLYGLAHDLPGGAWGALEKLEELPSGEVLLSGKLLTSEPDEQGEFVDIVLAELEIIVREDKTAPLGWSVSGFRAAAINGNTEGN